MTRRVWLLVLQAGLCAPALPGCAPFSYFAHGHAGYGDAGAADDQQPPNAQFRGGQPPGMEESEPVVTAPRRPDVGRLTQLGGIGQTRKQTFVQGPGQAVKEYTDPPLVLTPVVPPLLQIPPVGKEPLDLPPPSNQVNSTPGAPTCTEPLAVALNYLLKKQPAAALPYLDRMDKNSQEMFLGMLSALTVLNDKRLDQLSPEEAAALEEQLQGLLAGLHSRSGLVIDKMCLCEHIAGYGQYTPLRKAHAFQPGERVQVYVELRNIGCKRRGDYYLPALNGTVSISDGQGQPLWALNYRGRENPVPSLTPRSDCYQVYDFSVRAIPPGRYTLTLEVVDESREPFRKASKTVEFVVGPPGGG